MNIRKLAIAAAVLLFVVVAAYAGSSFYFGSQIKAQMLAMPDKMSQVAPFLKVSANEYHSGLFKSTHDLAFEVPMPGSPKGPVFTLHSVIFHGPLPNFGEPGAARIEQTLVFDQATAEIIAKAFDGADPVKVVTTVNLGGDGSTTLTGASLNFKAGGVSVLWKGFSGDIQFAKDMESYDVNFSAPLLMVTCGPGCSGNMKALAFKSHTVKIPKMELMTLGTAQFSLAEASMMNEGKPAFVLKGVTANSDVSSKDGEFMDFLARMAAAELTVADFTATKLVYDFSGKHWHAQSLENSLKGLQAAQNSIVATGAKGKSQDPAAAAAAMAPVMKVLATDGLAFLQKEPLVSIDRIGFTTPEGDVQLNVTARFAGVTATDVQNPMGLIAKIQAEGSAKVPELLIANYMAGAQISAMKAQGREATPEEQEQVKAQSRTAIEPKIAELALQGYVTRENGILSAKASFKGGQLLVNDKPFGPGGAPPAQ